jgi:uncharacterized protein (TIGR03435 family)
MIPNGVLDHLWQSTVFAALAAALAWALRNNHARVRSAIWLAASLKFLVPFAFLVSIGERAEWRRASGVEPRVATILEEVSRPFAPSAASVPGQAQFSWPTLMIAVWMCGCAFVLISWLRRWWRIRLAVRAATPVQRKFPIAVMQSPVMLEPGIFGIFRPILLLPEGITERLTPAQLDAILAHELCHVRRRDNLAAAIHMMVEAAFWFHPLVWWIGAKLVEERERACDEAVLLAGSEPSEYAAGILEVCKHYLESPLACAAGVTGANLTQRIENIMGARTGRRLDRVRKCLLTAAMIASVTGPVLSGLLNAPLIRAQAPYTGPGFEVASIKPSDPADVGNQVFGRPGGNFRGINATLESLIRYAYSIQDQQISGSTGWMDSAGYDIAAKAEDKATTDFKPMVQMLLADRFHLRAHWEAKELPVYLLVVAKGGPKLNAVGAAGIGIGLRRDRLNSRGADMATLASVLSSRLGRKVLDRTGLDGFYDFVVTFEPDETGAADSGGPSLFTALGEQLGLKLEVTKGPVEILVIDHAERPAAN